MGAGEPVGALFDRNARRYDLVNSVITFGQDAHWRRWAARRVLEGASAARGGRDREGPAGPPRVLDACAGTGLVGLETARLGARVTLADVSPAMLAIARERARARRLVVVDRVVDLAATPAPFLPASFDAVTLAFGLRYFDDPVGALANLKEVLTPGGGLVLLEAVVPHGAPASRAAGFYFFHIAPRLGTLLAGRRELYERLTATVHATGDAGAVLAMLACAGLDIIERRDWAFGLVVGVVARRPVAEPAAAPGMRGSVYAPNRPTRTRPGPRSGRS